MPPSDEALEFLLQAQKALPRRAGVRLLEREQVHLTLAFMGEVARESVDKARRVVKSLPEDLGGEAVMKGYIYLPERRKARVVAMELKDERGEVADLQSRVMKSLVDAGLLRPERRTFRPHVSIARLRGTGPLQPTEDCGSGRFEVESVCLYASRLTREGARYEVLERRPLLRPDHQRRA